MLKGMGISDGIGIGKAIILNNEDIKPEKIRTDDIEQEKKIFLDAIQSVKDEVGQCRLSHFPEHRQE